MTDSSDQLSRTLDDSPTVQLTGKIMVAAIIVLFLVVVFVLFLHLYAKWFWSRREDGTIPSRNEVHRRHRRFVFTPGRQDPAFAALRRGLDPSLLRSLPVLIFHPQDFKDGLECAVCLSELSEGEKARLLPKCNHGFHVDCIDMWFQSHSTCPLCRNPVAPQSPSSSSSDVDASESPELLLHSPEEDNSALAGYSSESPNFPTNVLFWGNQTRVSTGGGSALEEGLPSSQPPCSSSSSTSTTTGMSSSRPDEMLVIDIPRQMSENFASLSPAEEPKSPMTTRLRSLKRLLSRDRRMFPCSPSSVDVDQVVGRGQSSKSALDV